MPIAFVQWGTVIMTLESDYASAVVRLAIRRDDSRLRLIFAVVELLPNEMPQQPTLAPEGIALSASKHEWCYVRQVSMSVEGAIAWYRKAIAGRLITPVDPETPVPGDGQPVETAGLADDPPWPNFLVRSDPPFLADWHGVPRIHQLVAIGQPPAALEEVTTHPKVAPWLRNRLFFDLAAHPEWLGGMALIAPNPLARRIERRRVPPASGTPERTLVRVYPRTGADLRTLQVVTWERRGVGHALWTTHPLVEPWCVIDHPYEIREEGLAVVCTERGLLHWEEPASYVKQISLGLSMITARRAVTLAAGQGRAAETYVAYEMTDETVVVGQTPTVDTGAQRLNALREQARRRDSAEQLGQKWFHGNEQEARDFVRGLIGRARQRILVVDPYFAVRELFNFIPATTRVTVRIEVLTSAEVLRQPVAEDSAEEAGERLLTHLDTIAPTFHIAIPDVRVMAGRGAIHDRFLVIDGDVWFSGNSLNSIGERAGMLIRLPDPVPVISNLEAEFSTAAPLRQWVEQRVADRVPGIRPRWACRLVRRWIGKCCPGQERGTP